MGVRSDDCKRKQVARLEQIQFGRCPLNTLFVTGRGSRSWPELTIGRMLVACVPPQDGTLTLSSGIFFA